MDKDGIQEVGLIAVGLLIYFMHEGFGYFEFFYDDECTENFILNFF